MAHESCKSQIAVLEMNGQSVSQRWTMGLDRTYTHQFIFSCFFCIFCSFRVV